MEFIVTLLAGIPFPAPPTPVGWVVWGLLLAILIFILIRQRANTQMSWGLFILLFVLIPATTLFIGLRFASASARPLPGLPADAPGSALMIFSAIPWLLGGGMLGPIPAALLGAFAGLLRGAWDSYSLFSIVELAILAVWFSINMRQSYRTRAYTLLRQPLVGALLLIPIHALFYVLSALFTQWGVDATPITARLDFAISNLGIVTLAFGGEMFIGGLFAQLISIAFPARWGSKQALQPSPGEKSLEARFLFAVGAFILMLLLTLLIGDWVVAGRAARELLEDRLSSAGESASQSVPFFLETGQNLAVQLASDPRLLEATDDELTSIIGSRIQAVPYFDQFIVLDANNKEVLAIYPQAGANDFRLYPDEDSGIFLATNGVLTQIYSIPPTTTEESARVSFMVAIVDSTGQVKRILIGRTSLESNPLTLPLIDSLNNMNNLDGSGMLLNEKNQMLYHSDTTQSLSTYNGQQGSEAFFYDDTAPDGTREMVYYQPVFGRPWAIVLKVPAQRAQQIALNIALPLAVMIIVLAVIAMISLRLGLRVVTGSLQSLAAEANRIAQGQLDHPLQVKGEDEVAQLRRAFEQMRSSLQSRLEEINRLLQVSQGVASSLEMQDAVKPVLEAILSTGANSVRVALSPEILPDTYVELPSRFALGDAGELYAHFDEQILKLAQSQQKIVLPNLTRSREIDLDPTKPQPLALLAVASRHENRYYGVVWAGYEQPRKFSDSDVRFVTTLAGQAALAIANAHLFLNVEASRRQLEAILNSTPDPVLVTDHRNRLLLANFAAAAALGPNVDDDARSRVETEKVIKLKPLVNLLQSTTSEKQSAEIVLADKRTYLATASPVMVEGKQIGRVCIMRDVTHFKELDTMKSEFVATVSHDLRSPLTLMRGYATMLDSAGDLNEQQQGYIKKIISGVENMSRLVNNLLDLGRIEIGVGLQVENVTVLDVIERVTGALHLQAMQKNISLQLELAKDMPHAIEADQALLHQAVYNLVENGIKYTPDNGSVIIRTVSNPNHLTFVVKDSGIGIPSEDLPRLFEKFYRGKQREARAQPGSGLGLAIVHSIAESHSGKVWVDSEIGKGSAFYLQIPLAQPKELK